jgi:hypothetical protein
VLGFRATLGLRCQGLGRKHTPFGAILQVAQELLTSGDPSIHSYGPAEGLPPLREALREKLLRVNGLQGVRGGGRGTLEEVCPLLCMFVNHLAWPLVAWALLVFCYLVVL